MTRMIVLAVFASACASGATTVAPAQQPACQHETLDTMIRVRCLIPPGGTRNDVLAFAMWHPAVAGVYVEREIMRIVVESESPSAVTASVSHHVSWPPNAVNTLTEQWTTSERVLGPSTMSVRAQAQEWRVQHTYAECHALVMNIEASAANPARAQACSTFMASIDRNHAQSFARMRADAIERDERQRRSDAIRAAGQAIGSGLNQAGQTLQGRPQMTCRPDPLRPGTLNCN